MLFLLFQLGPDRYAVEAGRVVEVLPLVTMRRGAHPVRGLAGIFNYRGRPVPAIDLSELALGCPASERLSTRIIVVRHPDHSGQERLLGLIAERATEMLRADPGSFVDAGLKAGAAPYLGPLLMDANGPIQWLHEQRLLPESACELVFGEALGEPA